MPITFSNREDFENHVIAIDDDEGYEQAGYVVVVKGDRAAIARYSHCSCYGTWESLLGGGIGDSFSDKGGTPTWDWEGTVEELQKMAAEIRDPAMPERPANNKDSDYDHLVAVYRQVTKYYADAAQSGGQ